MWAYSGVVKPGELEKLNGSRTVAIDGYDNASSFEASIESSAAVSYISPVEFLSEPWVNEYGDVRDVTKVAETHIQARPLAGEGVDSLTEIGDYWYRFPSSLAMELCDIVWTDGARYFDSDGDVIFEDVAFGEPYRREYHALLASKQALTNSLLERGYKLVWYVTVQREANSLARERIPDYGKRIERSWLLWRDGDGVYSFCAISDEYLEPERSFEPSGFLRDLLEMQNDALNIEMDF